LPPNFRLEIDGKKLLLTHGSPESIDEHLYHDTPVERLKTLAEEAGADIVITGHSHEQYAREVDGAIFLNPGSVGRPGDENPQAAYAIIKFKPVGVELLRVDYNVTAAAETLRRKGLPESFAQMLLRGVPIERIVEEDRKRREANVRDCREATGNCEKISKQYLPDTEHQEQVRKLSLSLFDQMQSLHKLGNVERCWLECAAILHDIGISKTIKAHNKESMELILNDARLLLPSMDRRVVASIARYHRKGLPKKKHYNLASLSPKTVRKIEVLSGILRIADSLDYMHNGIVEGLALKMGNKRITINCTVSSQPTVEDQAFAKKKDLIEKVLKKRMVLIWKQR
jgi:exopolyphosphatase/guanosine-5'-triphosphate,3'-diphosphate pyrophosphatase